MGGRLKKPTNKDKDIQREYPRQFQNKANHMGGDYYKYKNWCEWQEPKNMEEKTGQPSITKELDK